MEAELAALEALLSPSATEQPIDHTSTQESPDGAPKAALPIDSTPDGEKQ
jgi:hypothetical protein